MHELHARSLANGVRVDLVDEQALKEIEPCAKTVGRALYVKDTAVMNPQRVMAAIVADAIQEGVAFHLGCAWHSRAGVDCVKTSQGQIAYGHLVNCAGLFADQIAHAFDAGLHYCILPFRGQFYRLRPESKVQARFVLVGRCDEDNPTAIERYQLQQWRHEGVIEWWGHRDDMPVVFASTVKVFGETTVGCVDESWTPCPETPYARSKWAAEQFVMDYAKKIGFIAVSLRLPMVYGPTQKGNFFRMIAAIDQGRFPPLPHVNNARSMLHVGNFVHATKLALQQSRNGQPAYVVTDENPYEISEIYELLLTGLGKTIPKWRMPLWMLKMGSACGDMIQTATGRSVPVNSSTLEKLIGSAWYSAAAITRNLGYCPSYRFIDAVPEMIRFYRASLR